MVSIDRVLSLLPGFNCGACGQSNCQQFARLLTSKKKSITDCPILEQNRFQSKKAKLVELLDGSPFSNHAPEKGLIDHAEADFVLHPLPDENSCRETLICFSSITLKEGQTIQYRPLGCPITHYGKIINIEHGLIDVWVEGPCKLLDRKIEPIEVGICMILSFQGLIEGQLPAVGQTVKFLPHHCMMGKVHSGIIVHLKNNQVRIDCIDLKIWEHIKIPANELNK